MTGRRAAILATAAVAAVVIVSASAAWACTIFATSVTASPNSGPALATITIQGSGVSGASGAEGVELRWDGAPGQVLAVAPVDAEGRFRATVAVPNAEPGVHTITAVADGSGVGRTTFEVASPASAGGPATAAPVVDPWVPSDQPPTTGPSANSVALTAGSALLAIGLVGLAGGFSVASLRRRRVSARV